MNKTKSFVKYFKNISNLINSLLEKNLNKLNFKNLNNLLKNNKFILSFVAIIVIFISYLLTPTFYKEVDISKKLQTELQSKFDINLKFSENLKYNFFPSPHFIVLDSTILQDQIEISKIKKLKIFVSSKNLFSLKNIKIKNLIFEKANFNIGKKNYNFFINLLNKDFKDGDLTIKDTNIFFKNANDEVLFINKVLKMKYFYDAKELKNVFYLDNEIFNIPFSIESFFNEDRGKMFSKIKIDLFKLRIENELIFQNKKIIGNSQYNLNNVKRTVEYEIEKNYFNFHIFDKIDLPNVSYKGKINFKPFYVSLDGNLDEIKFNNLFSSNSIITQLLKTEIFNNKNIDLSINIIANKIYKNFNFKNINLKSKIKDGLIDTDNTKFKWKNFADFELLNSLIFIRDGELIFDGKLKINVNDYNGIYKFLLTPKNYRKKISEIDLNFTYNFDQNIAELKDIKIDNKIHQNVNKVLFNVILKKNDLQNKIYFKNLLNKAIKSYVG